MNRRIALAHRLQLRFGWNPAVHDPDPLRFAILFLDAFKKGWQRGSVTGVAGHHFIAQRKALRRDNQRNDHLHAIRTLVPTVAKLALVPFSKRRITLAICAGQIVEQDVEFRVEEIFPAPDQMVKQGPLVWQQSIQTLVKLMSFRQGKIRSQQISHRRGLEPLPMQFPFAAWIQQPISHQRLQYQIPSCPFATGRQLLGPKPVQLQLFVQLTGQPARSPLPRPPQLHILEPDPHDLLAADLNGPILREQSHRLGTNLTLLKYFNRLAPGFLLARIDLSQIQHMPLDHFARTHSPVLHNRKIFVLFAILLAQRRTQKHAADYSKIPASGKRVGLHYNAILPLLRKPSLANQELTTEKKFVSGSNPRSRARPTVCRRARRRRRSTGNRA